MKLPLVPFDPELVGPFDLVEQWTREVREFVDDNSRVLIGSGVVLLIAIWWLDIGIPSVPNWMLVGALASLVASIVIWPLGIKIGDELHTRDVEILSEQSAKNGDQNIVTVQSDRFAEMRVVNQNGRQKDRSDLHEVVINGVRCYEVDSYDRDGNVAVVSWQGAISNSEMRSKKANIDRAKTTLEEEADKALEMLANHSDVVRSQVSLVANRMVQVTEQIELGDDDGQLHKELSDELEANSPSEELLGVDLDGGDDRVDLTDTESDDRESESEQIEIEDTGGSDE